MASPPRSEHADARARSMRVLIVSFVFPPHNIIGAVRVGKTAKYLWRAGHDVRVLAAREIGIDPTLDLEIPAKNVVYTPWTDVDRPYRALLHVRDRVKKQLSVRAARGRRTASAEDWSAQGFGSVGPQSERRRLAWRVRLLYTDLLHMPDAAIGWRRPAVRAGRELTARWRPDIILASGAPWTSLVVARDLSAQLGVPWVAELRDLWSANHTTFVSEWRKRTLDSWYEARVLRTAAALVTVSEPLAAKLRARYPGRRIDVVLNGFDDEDYARIDPGDARHALSTPSTETTRETGPSAEAILRLVYTGEINRDMLPLLEGIRLLGNDARRVRLEIIGSQSPDVRERYRSIAESYGIGGQCLWQPPVSHADAARMQQAADVLLLLMHDSPDDAGVYTGKLFEYIGARRPILLAGATSGVAADLLHERSIGFAEAAPQRIAERILDWLQEKHEHGRIAPPSGSSIDDLSRASQTARYAAILEQVRAR
jgi:glycosyltransferase involved in cell wall biosynthesis